MGCNPCASLRSALLRRGNLAPLSVGERGAGEPGYSGPLPPALLTNAFANPLEVCAAGAIIMTPSRPLLQRTSLCCAKIPVSIVDDGGEVMATAIGAQGLLAAC